MKVYVLGKVQNITGWLEGCVAGLRLAGHSVRVGVTRRPAFPARMDELLMSPRLGNPLARRIARSVVDFDPDLIVGILAYTLPVDLLEPLASLPGRPPLVGWVGDVFSPADRHAADLFDVVAYTDTAMLQRHAELGFSARSIYLPHAADPRLASRSPPPRRPELGFIGTPTERRRALLRSVRAPIRIYGAGWRKADAPNHQVSARRVGRKHLGQIYGGALASLNAPNEDNVLHGLNQRNFDPYVCGTAVIAQDQPDLARCFEPDVEVLTYRSAEELDAVCARLLRSPEEATGIGARGRTRVARDHTYARRLSALVRAL